MADDYLGIADPQGFRGDGNLTAIAWRKEARRLEAALQAERERVRDLERINEFDVQVPIRELQEEVERKDDRIRELTEAGNGLWEAGKKLHHIAGLSGDDEHTARLLEAAENEWRERVARWRSLTEGKGEG